MARPRTLPPEVRKKTILKAARTVLAKRGYQGLSLDEVARRARVAKGTLYLYFRDKMDLLAGVYEVLLGEIDRRIENAPRKRSAWATLSGIVGALLAHFSRQKRFFVSFHGGHPDLQRSRAGRRLSRLYERHTGLVAGRLKACVREGSLRPHPAAMGALYFDHLFHMLLDQQEWGPKKAGSLASKRPLFMRLLKGGLGR